MLAKWQQFYSSLNPCVSLAPWNVKVILRVYFSNSFHQLISFYQLISWAFPVRLVSGEHYRTISVLLHHLSWMGQIMLQTCINFYNNIEIVHVTCLNILKMGIQRGAMKRLDRTLWTPLLVSQHWFRYWLGVPNVNPDLRHHMPSLGHYELMPFLCSFVPRQQMLLVLMYLFHKYMYHTPIMVRRVLCLLRHFFMYAKQTPVLHFSLTYICRRFSSYMQRLKQLGIVLCGRKYNRYILLMSSYHSVYVPSQWEMALHCNAISHWLGAYTEWSLL